MARDNIMLKCTVCGEENYLTNKNKIELIFISKSGEIQVLFRAIFRAIITQICNLFLASIF